jgi:hypothetical protein
MWPDARPGHGLFRRERPIASPMHPLNEASKSGGAALGALPDTAQDGHGDAGESLPADGGALLQRVPIKSTRRSTSHGACPVGVSGIVTLVMMRASGLWDCFVEPPPA